MATEVVRVSKANPCPVCNKPDWCYFLGTDAVVCMRVSSNRPKKTERGDYGGYIHQLGFEIDPKDFIPATSKKNIPCADIDTLHEVYSTMFSMPEFCLTAGDYKQLKRWGVSVKMAKQRGYRRLPLKGRYRIAKKLLEMGYDLKGIPGFYVKSGDDGKKYWTFAIGPGLIFPSLSPEGKIQGFQVRLDNPGPQGNKYLWFSSACRSCGSSPGAPRHLARPTKRNQRVMFVTEGIRKADVISEYLGVDTIGLPGIHATEGVADYLNNLGVPVIIAYDMDLLKNSYVFEALRNLIGQIEGDVLIAGWHSKFKGQDTKGLDDLLVAGGYPKVIPVFQAIDSITARIADIKEAEKNA